MSLVQPGSQQAQIKEEIPSIPTSASATPTPNSQLNPGSVSQDSATGGSIGKGNCKSEATPSANGPQEIKQEPMEVGGKIIKTEPDGKTVKTEPNNSAPGGAAAATGSSGQKPSNGTGANSSKPDMKPPNRPATSATGAVGKQKPRSKKGTYVSCICEHM